MLVKESSGRLHSPQVDALLCKRPDLILCLVTRSALHQVDLSRHITPWTTIDMLM